MSGNCAQGDRLYQKRVESRGFSEPYGNLVFGLMDALFVALVADIESQACRLSVKSNFGIPGDCGQLVDSASRLACMSHHPSAEARDMTAMISFRLLAVLDVPLKSGSIRPTALTRVSEKPPVNPGAMPHPRRFAQHQ